MLRNMNQSFSRGRVCGTGNAGVLGSLIPSTGDNGAAYTYNDLSLPADNGKYICGTITTWPSAGTLYAYEDTSFSFTGAPDGTYTFQYQLYVDGVATGSPATATLSVGSGGTTISCTVGNAVAAGATATITTGTTISCEVGNAVAAGATCLINGVSGAVIQSNRPGSVHHHRSNWLWRFRDEEDEEAKIEEVKNEVVKKLKRIQKKAPDRIPAKQIATLAGKTVEQHEEETAAQIAQMILPEVGVSLASQQMSIGDMLQQQAILYALIRQRVRLDSEAEKARILKRDEENAAVILLLM